MNRNEWNRTLHRRRGAGFDASAAIWSHGACEIPLFRGLHGIRVPPVGPGELSFHWPLEVVVVVDVESFVSVEFSGRRKFFHSFDPPHSFELPFRPTDGADARPREKQKVCHRTRCGFSVGFVYLVAASLILSLGASLPQLASVPRREVQVRAVRHASVGRGCELRGFLLVKWKRTNFFVVL